MCLNWRGLLKILWKLGLVNFDENACLATCNKNTGIIKFVLAMCRMIFSPIFRLWKSFYMMAYLRVWRKHRAEVFSLVETIVKKFYNTIVCCAFFIWIKFYFSSDLDLKDSSMSPGSSEVEDNIPNFEAELAKWSTENKLTRSFVNDYMIIIIYEIYIAPYITRKKVTLRQ